VEGAHSARTPQPPVTLIWRLTLGRLCRRSMMKSWPLGFKPMAGRSRWRGGHRRRKPQRFATNRRLFLAEARYQLPVQVIAPDCRTSADDDLLATAIDRAIGLKPKGHDFIIDRRHNARSVSRHMSRHRRLRCPGPNGPPPRNSLTPRQFVHFPIDAATPRWKWCDCFYASSPDRPLRSTGAVKNSGSTIGGGLSLQSLLQMSHGITHSMRGGEAMPVEMTGVL